MGTAQGHPRPPGAGPRLLALLLAVAGAAAAPPRQVGAVLGGSVLLSPTLPHNETLKKIEWTFSSDTSDKILVAEVTPSGFERPDPRDRFGDRLDMNVTALRIRDLQRGDSGTYQARIKVMESARVEDQFFNLTLYEPLEDPEIQILAKSVTAEECNVTVRCHPPPGSAADVTWSSGVSQGHLCGDKGTLCVTVTTAGDSHTCVLRGRGQERNVTVRVAELCHQGDKDSVLLLLCLLLLGTLGVAALGVAWGWRKRKRKKSERGAAPEVLYSEVQSRNSPEPPEQEQPTTIYSQLQL